MAAQELPVKPPANQKVKRTNQLEFLWKLLEDMIKKDIATEFFSINHNENVKNPMDLKTVQLRLKYHFYVRGRDCIKDVHLIFSNACKHYYPDSIQVQNAKALENFVYAQLDDMPKPECEIAPSRSDKNSKPTKAKRKEKKISPIRQKHDTKISYRSSKIKKMPKIVERKQNFQKKISSKDKNTAVKEFQATVQEIMSDLSKLYRPLDYLDNLKLYDSLLKVKLLHEKFQKFSAVKQKTEGVTKIVNTPLGTSTTKKSNLHKPLQPKGKIVVLPSKSVGARAGLLLSDLKDVQLKLKSNTTLPHKIKSHKDKINVNPDALPNSNVNKVKHKKEEIVDETPDAKPKRKPILSSVNMLKPKNEEIGENPEVQQKPESKLETSNLNTAKSQKEKKPSDLEILLQSERFRLPTAEPTVTAERKRQREIAHQKRKSLAGKINICGAADLMRAFEFEHKIYQYNIQNVQWPKNAFTTTRTTTT